MKDKNLLCIRRNARKEIAKHFQLKKFFIEEFTISLE
jgi:hypothetical protein